MTAILRAVLSASALLGLAACEGVGGLDPYGSELDSGRYRYEAFSDGGGRGPSWWGYLDVEVDYDGRIYGHYRLPGQCEDDWGYLVDCVGRLAGRSYRDGTVRFGLDEGWLENRGRVRRGDEVTGEYNTRLLGYRDRGEFEMWRQ